GGAVDRYGHLPRPYRLAARRGRPPGHHGRRGHPAGGRRAHRGVLDAGGRGMTAVLAGSRVKAGRVIDRWLTMWNGDLALAWEIIAPELTIHLPQVGMPPESTVHDPQSMAGWIGLFRSSYSTATFTCELGPFVDGEHLISRFRFTGT